MLGSLSSPLGCGTITAADCVAGTSYFVPCDPLTQTAAYCKTCDVCGTGEFTTAICTTTANTECTGKLTFCHQLNFQLATSALENSIKTTTVLLEMLPPWEPIVLVSVCRFSLCLFNISACTSCLDTEYQSTACKAGGDLTVNAVCTSMLCFLLSHIYSTSLRHLYRN